MAEVKDKLVTVESLAYIYNSLNSKITQRDLLWENASPKSSFANQTISKVVSVREPDYDGIEIVYYTYNDEDSNMWNIGTTGIIPVDMIQGADFLYIDMQTIRPLTTGTLQRVFHRNVSIATNYYFRASFGDAITYSEDPIIEGASSATIMKYNQLLIPVRIYGYKVGG